MKRHRTSLILLSLLVLTSVVGIFSMNSLAQETDLNYTFQNDNLFNSTGLGRQSWVDNSSQNFNIRNRENITQDFLATYSFKNETGLQGVVISFVDSTTDETEVNIIAILDGHNEVIQNADVDGANTCTNDFIQTTSGIIEFWFRTNDVTSRVNIQTTEDGVVKHYIRMIGSDMHYYDGLGATPTNLIMVSDIWYHIKLQFYADNTWDYYINGIQYADGVDNYGNMVSGVNHFQFVPYTSTTYLDAIGYSWAGDFVDYNLTSLTITDGIISGNIEDASIDDANYFNVTSEFVGGIWSIIFDLNYGTVLPFDIGYLSYHMVSSDPTIVLSDNNGVIDSGATIDNDDVLLTDVTYIRITSDDIFFSFNISVFYISLSVFVLSYNIGDNIFPSVEIYDEQYEVDKWEFRHNPATRFQYPDGTDDPSGWNDRGDAEPVTDFVNTLNIGGNRTIVVHIDDSGGLERGFSLQDDYFEVTYNFEINQLDDDDVGANAIVLDIWDVGDTISSVYIRNNDSVEIFHDGGSTVIGTIDLVNAFTASFYLNFNSELVRFVLKDWNNGSVLLDFFGGFYDSGLDTITEIEYYHICTGGDVVDSDLFSVAIYNTTGAVSDDIGQLRWDDVGYDFPEQTVWDFTEFNLVALEGNFQNFSLFHESLGGLSFKNLIYWNSENVDFANVYESYSIDGNLVKLRLWMYYNFTFDSIFIDGVKLIQGSKEYPLIYTHDNVDVDESYFYVDSSNRLNGICHYNDSDLEYIQATFDINNVLNENRSLRFNSKFSGQYGNLNLLFTDTTGSSIGLPISTTSHNLILNQAKTIDSFIFLITDNDDLISGSGSGYISNIRLMWNPSISITIVTIALIMVIIPLIIMIVPTLLLYSRYGKAVIMPVFVFMAIICFAGGLIPAWLFFILMIGAGGFLVLKKGGDE